MNHNKEGPLPFPSSILSACQICPKELSYTTNEFLSKETELRHTIKLTESDHKHCLSCGRHIFYIRLSWQSYRMPVPAAVCNKCYLVCCADCCIKNLEENNKRTPESALFPALLPHSIDTSGYKLDEIKKQLSDPTSEVSLDLGRCPYKK